MLANLKKLRDEFGISQQKLADAIYVSQASINKYENHNTEPGMEILSRMADYFHTSVDYIIGYTDNREPHISNTTPFKAEEYQLIEQYRQLDAQQKACIQTVLQTLIHT